MHFQSHAAARHELLHHHWQLRVEQLMNISLQSPGRSSTHLHRIQVRFELCKSSCNLIRFYQTLLQTSRRRDPVSFIYSVGLDLSAHVLHVILQSNFISWPISSQVGRQARKNKHGGQNICEEWFLSLSVEWKMFHWQNYSDAMTKNRLISLQAIYTSCL